MAVYVEGDVLLSLQEPLRWGCGRVSGKSGNFFPNILDLR
jgi:hypothetical protein